MVNGNVRHLLSFRDLEPLQVLALCHKATELKKSKPFVEERPLLQKTVALLFEKPSLRTRVSFEVAVQELGGSITDLANMGRKFGVDEDAADIARVLSRYVDGVVVRTFSHTALETLAKKSTVPVINGLTDHEHPCQTLADLLTIQEKLGQMEGVVIGYVGDGNNVCHSLMIAAARMRMELRVTTPQKYRPSRIVEEMVRADADQFGGKVIWTKNPKEAVAGADIVYTDVWASMGQEKEEGKRRRDFRDFQVNGKLMLLAKPNAFFMHCLPAHRGLEVTADVIDGSQSIVFDQAENRLHIQKALLIWLIAGEGMRNEE